jgi:replicative DNA helicase
MNAEPLQNLEAERVVLGAVLGDREAPASAALKPADFASQAHRRIWTAILELDADGVVPDLVSLKDRLSAHGDLQSVGGPAFLGSLVDGLGRVSNLEGWCSIVQKYSGLRAVRAVALRMLALAQTPDVSAHDVLEQGMALLTDASLRVGATVDLDVEGAIAAARRNLAAKAEGEGRGFRTGLGDLDKRIAPLLPGQFGIVAARTGVGKSTLLANIGDGIAAAGGTVLLLSAEMARTEIDERRLLAEARVPSSHFEAGGISPSLRDWAAVDGAVAALKKRSFIVDASSPTPAETRAKARYVKAAHGLDVLLVDYLQLLPPGPGRKGENREQEVARVSRSLKRLAQDLDVCVIAAAQVNRAPEARRDKRPLLSDLRESGALEQDTDLVLLIHQDDEAEGEAEIRVAKHRNRGPSGWFKVRFEGAIHRFDNLAMVE